MKKNLSLHEKFIFIYIKFNIWKTIELTWKNLNLESENLLI